MTQPNARGRFTKGWAIAALAVMLFAVPAAAGIIVQNFLRADIEVNDACFSKTNGPDVAAASGLMTFDTTATVADTAGGVDLLQETATFQAYAGDRMLYTSAINFNNTCGHDLDLTFISAADPAGGAAIDTAAAFGNIDVRMYLPAPAPAGVAVPGLTGTWVEMLSVVNGTATNGTTPVTLADGGTLTLAVIIDADAATPTTVAPAAPFAGTLRWIAQADHG